MRTTRPSCSCSNGYETKPIVCDHASSGQARPSDEGFDPRRAAGGRPGSSGRCCGTRLTGRDPVGIAGAARGTVGGLGYSSRASCTGLGCEQGDRDCRLAFTVLLECDHLSRDPCCTGAAILGDLELGAQLVMTSEQPSPGAVQPDLRAGALAGGERDRVGSERHGSP